MIEGLRSKTIDLVNCFNGLNVGNLFPSAEGYSVDQDISPPYFFSNIDGSGNQLIKDLQKRNTAKGTLTMIVVAPIEPLRQACGVTKSQINQSFYDAVTQEQEYLWRWIETIEHYIFQNQKSEEGSFDLLNDGYEYPYCKESYENFLLDELNFENRVGRSQYHEFLVSCGYFGVGRHCTVTGPENRIEPLKNVLDFSKLEKKRKKYYKPRLEYTTKETKLPSNNNQKQINKKNYPEFFQKYRASDVEKMVKSSEGIQKLLGLLEEFGTKKTVKKHGKSGLYYVIY